MKWALNESVRNDVEIVGSFFIILDDTITKKSNGFIAGVLVIVEIQLYTALSLNRQIA